MLRATSASCGRAGRATLLGRVVATQPRQAQAPITSQAAQIFSVANQQQSLSKQSFAKLSRSRHFAMASATPSQPATAETAASAPSPPTWQVRMLYDGDCPLCMREVDMLRRRDEGKGAIDFVDISAPDYDPAANAGIGFEEAMGTIHAILADGRVVTNVAVFRALYEAVGLGWVYAVTRVEPFGSMAEALYGVWAKYRLQVTGRPDMGVILANRSKRMCRDQ